MAHTGGDYRAAAHQVLHPSVTVRPCQKKLLNKDIFAF